MKKNTILFLFLILAGAGLWVWLGRNDRSLSFPAKKMVAVNDGKAIFWLKTEKNTVGELLESGGFSLRESDEIYPQPEMEIVPGMIVSIQRSNPVEIKADGGSVRKEIFSQTVEKAIAEAGLSLGHLDKTVPERGEPVVFGQTIEITRINIEEVTEKEPIDFKTVEKEDGKVRWRKKEIQQKGEKGEKEIAYRLTYKDGKEVKREKLGSEVVKAPQDEIVKIGTKVEVGKTQSGRASWYAYTGTMACASVKFPKGTWLRVTSKASGKKIFVQVNHYGPDPGTGKIIDLDKVAFAKLAPIGAGVIEVKVEEILE